MRTWEAPTSTPSTTRPLAAIANCDDGRPPVETASPTGPTRPSFMRASMRRATVERARPVIAESSVRVRGRPSRRIWKRSLATEEPRAVMCPSLASATYVGHSLIIPCLLVKGCHASVVAGAPISVVTTQNPRLAGARGVRGLAARSTGSARTAPPRRRRRKSAALDPAPLHDLVGRRAAGRIAAGRSTPGTPRSRRSRRGRPRGSGSPAARPAADSASTPSSNRSRRRIASSRSSPGAGWPQQVFVHTPGHVRFASARRVRSIRPSASNA